MAAPPRVDYIGGMREKLLALLLTLFSLLLAVSWLGISLEWVKLYRGVDQVKEKLAHSAAESHQEISSSSASAEQTSHRMVKGVGVMAKSTGAFFSGVGAYIALAMAMLLAILSTAFAVSGGLVAMRHPGGGRLQSVLSWISLLVSIPWTLLLLLSMGASAPAEEGRTDWSGLGNLVVMLGGIPYFVLVRLSAPRSPRDH